MTREQAIALRPDSAKNYWAVLVLCGLAGPLMLVSGYLPRLRHSQNPWASITGLVILLFAFQAAERLFWPIRAAERTARLSELTRSILNAAKVGSPILGLVLVGIGMVRGSHSFLPAFGWGIYVSAHMFADLLGERLFPRPSPSASSGSHSFQRRNLQPIRSEHWGH
jgi:hypothetical protein